MACCRIGPLSIGTEQEAIMDTTATAPTVGEMLRQKRGDASKVATARALQVTPTTYDLWEQDVWVPGIRYADPIAAFLDQDIDEILRKLYEAEKRKRDMRPYINSAAA